MKTINKLFPCHLTIVIAVTWIFIYAVPAKSDENQQDNCTEESYDDIYQYIVSTWTTLGTAPWFSEDSLIDTLQFKDSHGIMRDVHTFSRAMVNNSEVINAEERFLRRFEFYTHNVKAVWKPTIKGGASGDFELLSIMESGDTAAVQQYLKTIKCFPSGPAQDCGRIVCAWYEYPELCITEERAEAIQDSLQAAHRLAITDLRLVGSSWFIVSLKAPSGIKRADANKIDTVSDTAQNYVDIQYPTTATLCFGIPDFNNYDFSIQEIGDFLQKNLLAIVEYGTKGLQCW